MDKVDQLLAEATERVNNAASALFAMSPKRTEAERAGLLKRIDFLKEQLDKLRERLINTV
jgi:hypothetical protein